jgi:tRNA dimethylallyltransferase
MNIGTAKPTKEEQRYITHHCIDIRDPNEYFSAGEYGVLARNIISKILNNEKRVLITGGSGLYLQALIDGVFQGNYRDTIIREKLKNEAEKKGWQTLYRRLNEIDPMITKQIHVNDKKRIIRALEVYELTGKPISKIQKEKTRPADFIPVMWGLRWPRNALNKRIDSRVERMMQSGLIDEVRQLLMMRFGPELNSLNSVGYKEIFEYLDGYLKLDETIELIKKNTRRYAKRQMTWFNRDKRIQWIDLDEQIDYDRVSRSIIENLRINK